MNANCSDWYDLACMKDDISSRKHTVLAHIGIMDISFGTSEAFEKYLYKITC